MNICSSKPKYLSDADVVSAARKHVKNGEFPRPGLPSSCGKRRYLNISGTEPSSCCIRRLRLLFLCWVSLGTARARSSGCYAKWAWCLWRKAVSAPPTPEASLLILSPFLLAKEHEGVAVLPAFLLALSGISSLGWSLLPSTGSPTLR